MLRELIAILRSTDPLRSMHDDFVQMTQMAHDMTVAAGQIYFGDSCETDRARVYDMDIEVNQLERANAKATFFCLGGTGGRAWQPGRHALLSSIDDARQRRRTNRRLRKEPLRGRRFLPSSVAGGRHQGGAPGNSK